MLERTKLRRKIVEILRNNTDAGKNVYSTRCTPWHEKNLPGISVYTPSERGMSKAASNIPSFDMTLTLNIEIADKSSENWDEKVDSICEQIEQLILKNDGLVKEFSQISSYSSVIDARDGGDMPIMAVIMSFDFIYTSIFEPKINDSLDAIDINVDCIDPSDPNLKSPGPDGRSEARIFLNMKGK